MAVVLGPADGLRIQVVVHAQAAAQAVSGIDGSIAGVPCQADVHGHAAARREQWASFANIMLLIATDCSIMIIKQQYDDIRQQFCGILFGYKSSLCSYAPHEKRKKIGMAGRRFVLQFEDYDFEEKWSSIFNSIFEEHERLVTEDEQIMMETLIAHHDIGLQTVRSQPKNQRDYTWRKTVKAAILLVKGKDYIVEHGAMEAIKKAAGKAWNHFRKNKN